MVDPKLIAYVRTCLSRKIPIGQIKKNLLSKGWLEKDINVAINSLNRKQVARQPVRQIPQKVQRIQQPKKNYQRPIQMTQKKEKPKIQLPKNLIFIFIGVFVLALIGIIVFLVVKNFSAISDAKLSEGVSVDLSENKEVKFNLEGEKHTMTVDSISEDSVSITIMSSPITATLDVGETKKFDLENDGIYDLSVKLNGIVDGKADIYFKKISEACVENWDCTEWSECEDEEETRTCTDLNECGTEKDKPAEVQECETVLSCFEQEGDYCGEREICDGDIIDDPAGPCCLGECIEIETIDCGLDIECLIYHANNCTLSSTKYNSDQGNATWDQTDIYYFEIEGLKEEKCQFYTKLTNRFGKFTSEGRTSLEEQDKTEEEIDQMEQQLNDTLSSMIGYDGSCNYSISSLVDILETTNENEYFDPSSVTSSECTGNLF